MEAKDSLLNKDGWIAGEDQTCEVTSDGLTLTSLRSGFSPRMRRMITIDLDRTPGLAVTVSRLVETETFEVRFRDEKEKSEGCLLESEAPGRFLLPLRGVVADGGVHTFFIIIGLRNEWGKGSATFSAMELVGENHPLARQKPSIPYLLSPRSGMTLCDIALDFRWRPAKGAAAYELELAGNESFADAHRHVVRTAGGGYYGLYINPIPFLPKTKLHPGTWHWRVRGVNLAGTPGDWSKVRSVVIRETSRPQPPKMAISSAHPLFIIDNAAPIEDGEYNKNCSNKVCRQRSSETLSRNWNSLPADIRAANLLLNISGAGYFSNQYEPDGGPLAWCCDLCEEAQKEGISLLLQIGTWPGIVDKGRYHALALSDVEWILQHYSCVKALSIVEQSIIVWGTRPREERFYYLACLIRLAAAHGRIVLWPELRDLWIHIVDDPGFMTVVRELREYFVPMWKTTLPAGAHVAQSTLLGLWLSGSVANWGVHADGWWWVEAGFAPHSVAGTRGIPASLYGQMCLAGISSGATVFSFECYWNIWDKTGKLTDKATQVVLPLIRTLTTHRLIPDQKTVQDNIKVACTGTGPDFKLLFKIAYGVRNAYQFIPASSRCYWIPILPPSVPVPGKCNVIIDDVALNSAEEIRRRLESCLPMDTPQGTAWTVRIGHWRYVMQSHENKFEEQVFGLDLDPPFAWLEGTLDANAYLLAGQNGNELILHIQKGRGAQCRIRIYTCGGMANIEPSDSIPGLVKEWNARDSFWEFKIQSPESVDIRATIGTANKPVEPLSANAARELNEKNKARLKAEFEKKVAEASQRKEIVFCVIDGSSDQITKCLKSAAGDAVEGIILKSSNSAWEIKNYGLREGTDSVLTYLLTFKETAKDDGKEKVLIKVLNALINKYGDKAKIISGWKEADVLKAREYKATGACLPLDLRKQTNMGFRDEKADDQKGGLFDEGRSLKGFPLGSNTFAGIVFEIIDPEKNNGLACIVLRGQPKPYFPEKAEGILVGRKAKNIYLLHGACYCARDSQIVYRLKFNYADNKNADADIKAGSEIADWFGKSEDMLANARPLEA